MREQNTCIHCVLFLNEAVLLWAVRKVRHGQSQPTQICFSSTVVVLVAFMFGVLLPRRELFAENIIVTVHKASSATLTTSTHIITIFRPGNMFTTFFHWKENLHDENHPTYKNNAWRDIEIVDLFDPDKLSGSTVFRGLRPQNSIIFFSLLYRSLWNCKILQQSQEAEHVIKWRAVCSSCSVTGLTAPDYEFCI